MTSIDQTGNILNVWSLFETIAYHISALILPFANKFSTILISKADDVSI
jgi:hypothetical protein